MFSSHIRISAVAFATAGLLLTLLPASTPAAAATNACVASAASGNATTYTHFTNPASPCAGSNGHDYNIRNELVRLINETRSTSWIRGNWYSLGDNETAVPAALLAAAQRGVTIRITYDAYHENMPAVGSPARALMAQLKNDFPGSLRPCPGDGADGDDPGACISNTGAAHTKAFAFSRTELPTGVESTYVVWVSSYNLTNGADGNSGWNNATTIYGDQDLYDFYKGLFAEMYARRHNTDDYYTSTTGKYIVDGSGSQVSVYASPEDDSDLVQNRLAIYTPTSSGCEARIVQSSFLGAERGSLLDLVASWASQGCSVQVATNHIDTSAISALRSAGAEVRSNANIHDKLVMLRMQNSQKSNAFEYRVFGGSHNWNAGSQNQDDILVRYGAESTTAGAHPRFDANAEHFGQIWGASLPCTGNALDGNGRCTQH